MLEMMSRWLRVLLLEGLFLSVVSRADIVDATHESSPPEGVVHPVRFTDVTESAGIRFRHTDGRSGRKYLLETLGSGAVFFDYDNDGDPDLYAVNGADLPGTQSPEPPTNHLYRNNGDGTFTDATAQAGVGDSGYGFGCAAGDADNDGDEDLYVTNFGANVLYRNNGDGTFSDVTAQAGVGDLRWSASCAFLDYDRDGWLDLYVVNYMRFSFEESAPAVVNGLPTYRSPVDRLPGSRFEPERDTLYHNNGDGTFTDVSEQAGITLKRLGLALAVGDYDDDGDPDIAVVNDMEPDILWRNNGDGTFTDAAPRAGTGYDENGVPGSGMGAAFADYDNDGDLDLVVSNAPSMPVYLFRNDGSGMFSDESYPSGVGEATLPYFKWAVDFVDYDNDGWSDLFVVNGHLQDNIASFSDAAYPQQNLLLRNEGNGHFSDASEATGFAALPKRVGRGAAFADYDNDGDLDLFLNNSDEPATLLRNDPAVNPSMNPSMNSGHRSGIRGGNRNHWLTFRVIGTKSNRSGIGTRIRVVTRVLEQTKEVKSGSGYLSQNDLRLTFGLGTASKADTVEIRWQSGLIERLTDIPTDRILVIREGENGPVDSER